MKPSFAAALVAAFVTTAEPAQADYRCTTDLLGTQRCSGSLNGQSIKTTSNTDLLGNTRTTGQIGERSLNQTCWVDLIGNTHCQSGGF